MTIVSSSTNVPVMTLSDKRCLFTYNLALLIAHATDQLHYRVALDQVRRTQAEAAANAAAGTGIANSVHLLGLAADLLLYVDGIYITASSAYAPLGVYWRGLHPLNRWGGDFRPRPDGNHFSMEHNGVK